KRLAVRTEDHPLEYGRFEGTIPEGEYGAGTVMLWDTGTWRPESDPAAGLAKGKLAFELFGKRLKGKWALVRLRGRKDEKGKRKRVLIKQREDYARAVKRPIEERELSSIKSGRTKKEIAADKAAKKRAAKKLEATTRAAKTSART